MAKRTEAAEGVAQSLMFGGDGFRESLLNPVKDRFVRVDNKGREFSRIGFSAWQVRRVLSNPAGGACRQLT